MTGHNGAGGRVHKCRVSEESAKTGGDDEKVSLKCVYSLIFVLFVCQLSSVPWLYGCFLNLNARYEAKFSQLEERIRASYEDERHFRSKRDLGSIQDNSITRSDEFPGVLRYAGDNDTARNDTAFTIDDVVHMKHNFSSDDWIWLNKYSRVPVSVVQNLIASTLSADILSAVLRNSDLEKWISFPVSRRPDSPES
jgi:hypothetical protein